MSSLVQVEEALAATKGEIEESLNRLDAMRAEVGEMAARDPLPMEFFGVVRRYRFSQGRRGVAPTHSFQIEGDGGLWLMSRVASGPFDDLVRLMRRRDKVQGMAVRLVRDPEMNMVVPRAPLGRATRGKGARGQVLWIGCSVLRAGTGSGVVVGDVGDEAKNPRPIVNVDYGRGPAAEYADMLSRAPE